MLESEDEADSKSVAIWRMGSNPIIRTIDSFVAFGITITDKKQPRGKNDPSFTKLPDSLERQAQALDFNS